jgi:hypothetical protein
MLASNPLRNSRPELIADDGQGMFFLVCPIPWQAARPESGTRPRGKKQERHIGPIDSDMPQKTPCEGALIFHAVCSMGAEEEFCSERSNSIGGR